MPREVLQSVFPSPATSPPSPIVRSSFSSPKIQPKEQLEQPNQDIHGKGFSTGIKAGPVASRGEGIITAVNV